MKWWGSSTGQAPTHLPAHQQQGATGTDAGLKDKKPEDNSSGTIVPVAAFGSQARMHYIGYAAFGVVLALGIAGLAYWGKRRFYDRRRRGYGNDSYEFHALNSDGETEEVGGIIQQARRYVTTRELFEAFGEEEDMEGELMEADADEDEDQGEEGVLVKSVESLDSHPDQTVVERSQPVVTGELMYENELLCATEEEK
jgi:hypothetical protein